VQLQVQVCLAELDCERRHGACSVASGAANANKGPAPRVGTCRRFRAGDLEIAAPPKVPT
jgi:hypothetical protein